MSDSEQFLTTRIGRKHVRELDEIARQKMVNRSIVVRWAIDAYIASFFSPSCPINETVTQTQDSEASDDQK